MNSRIEALPDQEDRVRLERKLARAMGTSIVQWRLVEPGDHIMVAMSGGKDSYSLLDLLVQFQRRAPITFQITAVHLDQHQPGYDGAPLREWLDAFGVPFHIASEDTYSTVLKNTQPGKAYCSVCSRMRRGILYSTAQSLGCNKIALGHHRDDALETLLMNMFFGGRMQAMPAIYKTDDGRFDVIRPLIECAESDIARYAHYQGYPILPCNLCGSQDGLQREAMKKMLHDLELQYPNVRTSMLGALKNVRPSHLLDASISKSNDLSPHKDHTIYPPAPSHAPGELIQLGRRPTSDTDPRNA